MRSKGLKLFVLRAYNSMFLSTLYSEGLDYVIMWKKKCGMLVWEKEN